MAGEQDRLDKMRHALRCIAMDAGFPIEGRGPNKYFDLDMCRELAAFGLSLEPDREAIAQEVEAYRAKLTN